VGVVSDARKGLAKAYGVEGRRMKSPGELKAMLLEVFKRDLLSIWL